MMEATEPTKTSLKPRPFVKWAGGKSRIAKMIANEFPTFNNYFEPFLGSGAIYFEIAPQSGILNDLNSNLISTYNDIKKHPKKLMLEMDAIQNIYNNLKTIEEKSDYYYQLRNKYNSQKNSSIKKSALFIFLNKAGWNGMYRENSNGGFNIPFGKREAINLYDEDNILRISKNIQKMTFTCKDYKDAAKTAQPNDLVYFDPPYFETFSDYQKNGFSDTDQQELHDLAIELTRRGCHVVISNSDCEKSRNLYKDFTRIVEIPITRTIGSKVSSRQKINEILILNY